MTPATTFVLRVRDGRGQPLRDHPIRIRQGDALFEVRTGVDGTVRVFPGLQHRLAPGDFTAEPMGGASRVIQLRPEALRYGRPVYDLTASAQPRSERRLDLGFVIDATGSMTDELAYLQTELRDIVARVAHANRGARIRIAVVFYRDRGDEFVTRVLPFTDDVDRVIAFLGATEAGGGGDYPEEMNEALRVMMAEEWSDASAARMLFVLGDAPPHYYEDARYTYREAVADAVRRGIAVFPLAASGVDRRTEYLMRAMAVMTGGRYVFLTDDSGVGLPHLTPREPFRVRPLNDLMVAEIQRYASRSFRGIPEREARPGRAEAIAQAPPTGTRQ